MLIRLLEGLNKYTPMADLNKSRYRTAGMNVDHEDGEYWYIDDVAEALAGHYTWLSITEFQKEPNEGWCWVCLSNGRTSMAWHTHKEEFLYHPWSHIYFVDVEYAMPLFNPPPPEQGED